MNEKQELTNKIYQKADELNELINSAESLNLTVYISQAMLGHDKTVLVNITEQIPYKRTTEQISTNQH